MYLSMDGAAVRVTLLWKSQRTMRSAKLQLLFLCGRLLMVSTKLAPTLVVPECGNATASQAPSALYSVVGTGQVLTVSTCTSDPTRNGDFDSQISILKGNCRNLECVTGVDDDDNDSCGSEAGLSWQTENGEQYYILVHGWNGGTGDFSIELSRSDICDSAIGPIIPGTTENGSTKSAALFNVEACGTASEVSSPGVTYSILGTGGIMKVTVCPNFDAQVTVMSGACSNLRCVAGSDGVGQNSGSDCNKKTDVSWSTTEGRMSYILVHGHGLSTGEFNLEVSSL